MTQPITVDIPHQHGREVVRERLESGIGKLAGMFPGGAVVDHRWEGETMHFTVQALGQKVASRLELFDTHVHATIDLPPFLSLFAEKIRAKLAKEGPKLLQ
ncbi:hypothetical protein G4G27_11485 [Sphingomonas sp. So64.6b]|jgi:hypothetical protein|uniref:polyhydroxyalkanoic acid system family protein n=1 Tax=Sphingomonas sp. So64.6b TaxID=2997354 RepID=UPI001603AF76|nr:polyhydroxyalkanoic acid system family protein [Sphingomonas sp. So64.6b]QNA84543.1 hypothetical protein G4G27_11485 [Sphingomonas sp. So64.6b]